MFDFYSQLQKKLGIYKWNINSNPHNHRYVLLYFNSDLAK